MSLGTALPPDPGYLDQVREFAGRLRAPWYSEHLAFTKVPGLDLAQLLPLPRTEEVLQIVCEHVSVVQERIGLDLLLENISYYYEYPESELGEAEFLVEVCERTGAGILLDLENLRINSINHRFDPLGFLAKLAPRSVRAIHVAGGCSDGGLVIDSHDHRVPAATLGLLKEILRHQEPDVIIVERDQGFAAFEEALADVEAVTQIRNSSSTTRARLLARQRAILVHLADPTAYESTNLAPAEALQGIDVEPLKVLGRLILAKRMSKIEALLPATCRCASAHVPALMKEFAAACPPHSLGREDNAIQFHDFVVGYEGPPPPPNYLADLVRLEYLAAAVTFAARDRPGSAPVAALDRTWTAFDVRMAPGLRLFETEFDLRAALGDSPPPALERGDLRRIAIIHAAKEARVFSLEEEIVRLLFEAEDWSRIDARRDESVRSVVESLAGRGLLEVRPCGSAS